MKKTPDSEGSSVWCTVRRQSSVRCWRLPHTKHRARLSAVMLVGPSACSPRVPIRLLGTGFSSSQLWGCDSILLYLLAQGAPFILSARPHFARARCLRLCDPALTRTRPRVRRSWQLRSRCDSRASARMCAHTTRSEVRICHLRCSC
jgi:hypothetical protein